MKKTLSQQDLQQLLKSEPDWKLTGGALVREWSFPDFAAAMLFVNQVATAAEAAGHHPDIDIRYNKVRLSLVSHDAGGITQRDVDMTRKLDSLNYGQNLKDLVKYQARLRKYIYGGSYFW